ncbi:hypothetical protein Hanom_Chr02g00115381 [Helianthus anomalus]
MCKSQIKGKKILFKQQVGRLSGECGSSNDRLMKEPKTVDDEDPFGLDPIINGIDEHVVKSRGPSAIPVINSFQALISEESRVLRTT